MRLSYAIVALLAFHVTAHGADAADALAKLDTNGNHIVEEAEAQAGGRKLFADLDKNGDGLLQPEELNERPGPAVLKAAILMPTARSTRRNTRRSSRHATRSQT